MTSFFHPTDWPFILAALIVSGIGLSMLWKFCLHKHIFRINRFIAKYPGCSMSWSNFWCNAPIGTVLTVSAPSGSIGRTSYAFAAEIGYQTADVPISDAPSTLRPGKYKKNFLGSIVPMPTEA